MGFKDETRRFVVSSVAIYSLNHKPIGRTTQERPHTSAAHVSYITRPSAASRIEAARMPQKPQQAAAFMVDAENADRKNARVADKLMLALPRELDAAQRAQLVRDFAEEVTQGRAPWLAAFHDQGKDAHNPHAHLLIRDRDPATGKRVAGLSEKGSTAVLRALWETHANRSLERAGHSERINRRTLEAQGIARSPTVHEGPKAQQMDRRGARPRSRTQRYRNRPGSRLPYRDVDYCGVDGGRSRPAYNREVSRPETPAELWAAIDAHQRDEELGRLRAIHQPATSVDVLWSRRPLLADDVLDLDNQSAGCCHFLLPLPDTVPNERLSSGVCARPTIDEPRADNGQSQQKWPNDFLGKEGYPPGNFQLHASNINGDRFEGKEKFMDYVDKILERHKTDLINAEFKHNKSKSLLDDTMKRAFLDPKKAMSNMDEYTRQKNSREALYNKLNDKDQVFGRRPGSMLSTEYFKTGAKAKRRDADIARQQLPHVLREADKNREDWANAHKSLQDARDRYYPKSGAGGGRTEGQAPTSGQTPQGAGGGPAGGQARPVHPQPQRGPETPQQAHGTVPQPQRPNPQQTQSAQDKQNNDARREAREQLVREQNPAYAKKAEQPQSPQQQAEPRTAGQDKQNSDAMREARERWAKEQNPAYAKSGERPQQQTPQPAFSDKTRSGEHVPPRTGSFSDKLADMRKNPQQEKASPARRREEEIER